jgi:hypothetical protein
MNSTNVYGAVSNGIKVSHMTSEDLATTLNQYTSACENYGVSFDGWNYTWMAQRLKDSYSTLTDREVSLVLVSGLEGKLNKKPPQTIRPTIFFEWVSDYLPKKHRFIMETNDLKLSDLSKSADLTKTPYGIAMKFKYSECVKMKEGRGVNNTTYENFRDIPVKKLMELAKTTKLTRQTVMKHFNIK